MTSLTRQTRRPQVVEGRIIPAPLPTQNRAVIRWLKPGQLGAMTGTLAQIAYTRALLEAEGIPLAFNRPQPTAEPGKVLVSFRVTDQRMPWWPFIVAGLALVVGIVIALDVLAFAIADSMAYIIISAAVVTAVYFLVNRARRSRSCC